MSRKLQFSVIFTLYLKKFLDFVSGLRQFNTTVLCSVMEKMVKII